MNCSEQYDDDKMWDEEQSVSPSFLIGHHIVKDIPDTAYSIYTRRNTAIQP